VEGWHTGSEWIDTGALVRRVNFMANKMGDPSFPGVASIINRLGAKSVLTPEELVDGSLELLGHLQLNPGTRKELIEHARSGGALKRGATEEEKRSFAIRASEMLQLIAATREYQFC
jgi:hypothetical protein